MACASYAWARPMILVENKPDGKLEVNSRTLDELNKITDLVIVVGIVGLYRTGKSYLMNRLAGHQSGELFSQQLVRSNRNLQQSDQVVIVITCTLKYVKAITTLIFLSGIL